MMKALSRTPYQPRSIRLLSAATLTLAIAMPMLASPVVAQTAPEPAKEAVKEAIAKSPQEKVEELAREAAKKADAAQAAADEAIATAEKIEKASEGLEQGETKIQTTTPLTTTATPSVEKITPVIEDKSQPAKIVKPIITSATTALSLGSVGDLRKDIAADYDTNLGPLFTHFHTNPELSFRETKTADRLATEIEALGYTVTKNVGQTGVVAVMENGEGPTVMIRADMDGLPVKEDSGLSYASTATQVDIDGIEKPVMHACGHDVHITSLVGSARQLAARKDDWSGTLVLIGQPAEERIAGARVMLEDGLYERFPKPDYALAFHVSADTPIGQIEMPLTSVASSSDSVDIVVHGIGAHGASPHKGIDPVLVASQIVVSLQSVVSRTIAPLDAGVITVGSFHGGFKHNIISDRVEMQITVRSDDASVREQLLDGIDRVAKGVALAHGVPEDMLPEVIRSKTESTPPTINDTALATRLRTVMTDKLGKDVLLDKPRQGMGAEDFAYFVAPETGVKGVYFSVGGTPADEVDDAASHHSPFFKITPEPAIKLGTEAMVWAALDLLQK